MDESLTRCSRGGCPRSGVKDVFSAKGADIHIRAWGNAPGIHPTPNISAEGATHSVLTRIGAVIRAFSAGSRSPSKSWGAAPGYNEKAPLALNTYAVNDPGYRQEKWTKA